MARDLDAAADSLRRARPRGPDLRRPGPGPADSVVTDSESVLDQSETMGSSGILRNIFKFIKL